jgi:hypothetical protein
MSLDQPRFELKRVPDEDALKPSPFNMCPALAKLSSRLSDHPYLPWR